jgi:uncharacterized protein YqgV (UPF0045/DUF77 family)
VTTVRLEFTVEPFVDGNPGPHVRAAIDFVESSGHPVVMGPFGSVVEADLEAVSATVAGLVDAALAEGATRVWLAVERTGAQSEQPNLHGALDRLIGQVERELGGRLSELGREDKQRAVRLLEQRGAFTLRKAVDDLADALGVSRITVYNYLNQTYGRSAPPPG